MKLFDWLFSHNRNWYQLKTVTVNNHDFFYVEGKLQCVYCLYVQPTLVHKFDRNKDGRVVRITIESFEEGHQENCRYIRMGAKKKVNWFHYFFPSQVEYDKRKKTTSV